MRRTGRHELHGVGLEARPALGQRKGRGGWRQAVSRGSAEVEDHLLGGRHEGGGGRRRRCGGWRRRGGGLRHRCRSHPRHRSGSRGGNGPRLRRNGAQIAPEQRQPGAQRPRRGQRRRLPRPEVVHQGAQRRGRRQRQGSTGVCAEQRGEQLGDRRDIGLGGAARVGQSEQSRAGQSRGPGAGSGSVGLGTGSDVDRTGREGAVRETRGVHGRECPARLLGNRHCHRGRDGTRPRQLRLDGLPRVLGHEHGRCGRDDRQPRHEVSGAQLEQHGARAPQPVAQGRLGGVGGRQHHHPHRRAVDVERPPVLAQRGRPGQPGRRQPLQQGEAGRGGDDKGGHVVRSRARRRGGSTRVAPRARVGARAAAPGRRQAPPTRCAPAAGTPPGWSARPRRRAGR